VAVFGATFAFFALIPLLFPPDNPQPAPVAPPPSQPTIPSSPPSHSGGEPTAERPGTVWTVPYSRNPFFTGRERLLALLHDNLTTSKAAALTQAQAISGLGGIGKTQTAVEYAYRYREEYRFVLWANATTHETLIADFVTLAGVLDLPEKNEQDQNITVAAVKRWLAQHDGWLLILDNADDLAMARDYILPDCKGHILLTTRAQAAGAMANSIEVEKMDKEEGALFLLRRAKVLSADASLDLVPEVDRRNAETIVSEMDGLPLALDQAGAYIEETGCGVATYLDIYRKRRAELLRRRGGLKPDYPLPVASTWSLSFQKVEAANLAAADLLRLCAFLAPDAIPEEIITAGESDLSQNLQSLVEDPLKLPDAIGELRKYSLVRRNPDQELTIHHLVQAVLKASMDDETPRAWAERAVRAVNSAFPYVKVATWPQCKRYLPHAQACAELVSEYEFEFPEAARLLNQAASYLFDHALYVQAEPLYQRTLAIREKLLGPEHPDTATSLNNLTELYRTQGKYEQAEPLYHCAHVAEKTLPLRKRHHWSYVIKAASYLHSRERKDTFIRKERGDKSMM
jgi:tetratricopeptide (TPR) repeat protein